MQAHSAPAQRCAAALALVTALVGLTGCTAPTHPSPDASPAPSHNSAPPTDPPADSDDESNPEAPSTPEAAFRAWLAASRVPDPTTACSYLSEELVEKMLAILAEGGVPLADCTEMITTTAELYAAFGKTQEVDVETLVETPERAELRITYAEGDCGRVEMVPNGPTWIMTENTDEEC